MARWSWRHHLLDPQQLLPDFQRYVAYTWSYFAITLLNGEIIYFLNKIYFYVIGDRPVTMQPCDDRRDNKFVYDPTTSQIKIASDPTKCLDIKNEKNENGAILIEHKCHGKSNQKWTIIG